LIRSINRNLGSTVDEKRLDILFDKLWPDLNEKLTSLPMTRETLPPKRSTEEIAAETLELVRALVPAIKEIASETEATRHQRVAKEQALKYNYNLVPSTLSGLYGYSPSEGTLGRLAPLSSLAASEPEEKQKSIISRAVERAAKAKTSKEKP